jgi:hypothetical protein
MSKIMHEIEVSVGGDSPTYIYIETDDDMDINFGPPYQNSITHVTIIGKDIGMNPDLIISRKVEE